MNNFDLEKTLKQEASKNECVLRTGERNHYVSL